MSGLFSHISIIRQIAVSNTPAAHGVKMLITALHTTANCYPLISDTYAWVQTVHDSTI